MLQLRIECLVLTVTTAVLLLVDTLEIRGRRRGKRGRGVLLLLQQSSCKMCVHLVADVVVVGNHGAVGDNIRSNHVQLVSSCCCTRTLDHCWSEISESLLDKKTATGRRDEAFALVRDSATNTREMNARVRTLEWF